MRAHIGDWLIVPPGPHDHHERRGQIVELLHTDGSPPYRVRWLEDDHVSVVFPSPDSHLRSPEPARTGLTATAAATSAGIAQHQG